MPPKAPPPPPPPRASASTPATASIRGRLSNSKVLTSKRKANSDAHDPSISPPPTRRKIQSSVSNTVVASFFTPASQKPKAKKGPVAWEERAPAEGVPATLLVATFQPEGSRQGQDHDQKASESGGESEGESESKSKSKSKNKSASAPKRRKVAAFDLDSTLITTASGKKHAESATDWTWWDRTVPQRLRALHDDEGYAVVIFSNQGGLVLHPENSGKAASSSSSSSKASKSSKPKPGAQDRVADFKQKCAAVLTDLGLPVTLYAATGKDRFRKPRPGMWQEMVRDLGLAEGEVDLSESFFVGDAAGRLPYTRDRKMVPKDFSCSDRNLAANVGVRFETPEEYFLGEAPREYVRGFDLAEHPFVDAAAAAIEAAEEAEEAEAEAEAAPFKKGDGQELVVFCGPPGAGKSTFFRTHLEPLGFERVNQDTLKTKTKCVQAAAAFLQDGLSVAIDNTNPDPTTRALWVDLAKKHGVAVRCVWFQTDQAICLHNDAVRSQNKLLNPDNREALPRIAFNGFFAKFRKPEATEGFSDITEVAFTFRGTKEEYGLWGTYWL